jgi:hypothetical protein
LLLNSLPDTYYHLITTLLYGNDVIKINDVSNTLTNNEQAFRDMVSKAFICVDDMLVACKNELEIDRLKTQLSSEFEM